MQNGNHVDPNQDLFPQLALMAPQAQRAFDLLVRYVEQHVKLLPDQCVPRGQTIADAPAQPGHCTDFFVP